MAELKIVHVRHLPSGSLERGPDLLVLLAKEATTALTGQMSWLPNVDDKMGLS